MRREKAKKLCGMGKVAVKNRERIRLLKSVGGE